MQTHKSKPTNFRRRFGTLHLAFLCALGGASAYGQTKLPILPKLPAQPQPTVSAGQSYPASQSDDAGDSGRASPNNSSSRSRRPSSIARRSRVIKLNVAGVSLGSPSIGNRDRTYVTPASTGSSQQPAGARGLSEAEAVEKTLIPPLRGGASAAGSSTSFRLTDASDAEPMRGKASADRSRAEEPSDTSRLPDLPRAAGLDRTAASTPEEVNESSGISLHLSSDDESQDVKVSSRRADSRPTRSRIEIEPPKQAPKYLTSRVRAPELGTDASSRRRPGIARSQKSQHLGDPPHEPAPRGRADIQSVVAASDVARGDDHRRAEIASDARLRPVRVNSADKVPAPPRGVTEASSESRPSPVETPDARTADDEAGQSSRRREQKATEHSRVSQVDDASSSSSAASSKDVVTRGPAIDVVIQNAAHVRLESPVSRISVEHSDVVQLVESTPTTFSLIGLKLGETRIALLRELPDGKRVIELRSVKVAGAEADSQVAKLAETIGQAITEKYPNCDIEIVASDEQLIVSGRAVLEKDAEKIISYVRKKSLMPVVDQLRSAQQ